MTKKTGVPTIYNVSGSGTQILHNYKYKRGSFNNMKDCNWQRFFLHNSIQMLLNKAPFVTNMQCFSSSFWPIWYMDKLLSMYIKVSEP